MNQIFITNIKIDKVRHLKDISIPLSENEMKPLILTGKNGSGKTSVVEALAGYLNNVFTDEAFAYSVETLYNLKKDRDEAVQNGIDETEILELVTAIHEYETDLRRGRRGVGIEFNIESGRVFHNKTRVPLHISIL